MPGQVKAGCLLLHGHSLRGGELLHIRQYEGRYRPVRIHGKQVELTDNVAASLAVHALQYPIQHLQERPSLVAQGVEGPGADEAFHRAAVQLLPVQAAAEFVKGGKGAVCLPLRHDGVDKSAANALDRDETEADVLPRYGKIRVRLVHIRRQQLYAHALALGDILRHLPGGIEHAGEKRRHILPGPVAFHPCRAIAYDGVGYRVGLVEGIGGKVEDLVVNAVGDGFRHPVCHAAGDAAGLVAMDERLPLRVDDGVLFFRHGAADHVCLAEGEARKPSEYLDDLLLIDDAAVGDGQDRLKKRVLVGNLLRVHRAFQKAGDGVHRPGTVQRDDGGDILNALWPQPHRDARHASGFQLEHAGGASVRKHSEGLRIVLGNIVHPEGVVCFPDEHGGVLQNRQVSEAEKVHFQKPQLLQLRHGELADDGLVVSGKGYIVCQRVSGYDDAGSVGRGVPGHSLQAARRIDQHMELLAAVVKFLQGLGEGQGLVQRHFQVEGNLLCHGVRLAVADVQNAPYVPNRRPCGHGAEGNDLRHMVGAVLPVHIVNDLAPAADTEIHIDIRHGHTLGI